MKALIVDGKNGLRCHDVPQPVPRPGQLRIETVCSLVSPGTELHYIDQSVACNRRLRLGYCASGYVQQAAAGCGDFVEGQHVIALGWEYACHAEVNCVPYRFCAPVPDGMSFQEAVFATLAATAVHTVDRAQLTQQEEVLVVGAGIVGQLVAQCAAPHARRVVLADRSAARLESANLLGAVPVHVARDGGLCQRLSVLTPRPAISTVFLCLTGDATATLRECVGLLSAARNASRPKIVCVGRFRANVDFSVEMGNLDIRYASRCGAGYRDNQYAHGFRDAQAPPGEATVTENLRRSLALIFGQSIRPRRMCVPQRPFAEAISAYKSLRRREAFVSCLFRYRDDV